MRSWPAGEASSVCFFALTTRGEDCKVLQAGVRIDERNEEVDEER